MYKELNCSGLLQLCDAYSLVRREYYFDRWETTLTGGKQLRQLGVLLWMTGGSSTLTGGKLLRHVDNYFDMWETTSACRQLFWQVGKLLRQADNYFDRGKNCLDRWETFLLPGGIYFDRLETTLTSMKLFWQVGNYISTGRQLRWQVGLLLWQVGVLLWQVGTTFDRY